MNKALITYSLVLGISRKQTYRQNSKYLLVQFWMF